VIHCLIGDTTYRFVPDIEGRVMSASRHDAERARSAESAKAVGLVWAEPPVRRRAPLTRENIVETAVSIADAEGLEAVTIRRLAAQLQARPMSLYSFAGIERKEDLFDLMIDEVCAEMLLNDPLPEDWREALRATAVRTRAVLMRHPWWLDLIGRRVLIGPNATRYREQTLAAVADLSVVPALEMAVVTAVETYTIGQAALSVDRQGPSHKADRSFEQWRDAVEAYQQALMATGDFPNLARMGPAEPTSPEALEQVFTLGLDWLLAGISSSIGTPPNSEEG
jgi:AcrR family transcriptional regulator